MDVLSRVRARRVLILMFLAAIALAGQVSLRWPL